MPKTQQTVTNSKTTPIYVSVEPWPECFKLEPGDKLTLIWDAVEGGDASEIFFVNESELAIWANGNVDEMQFLINGEPGRGRSWAFNKQV